MFKFLKVLFGVRNKKITLILVQENKPAEPESFSFFSKRLFQLMVYIIVFFVVMGYTILAITPLGYTLFDREDAEIRRVTKDLSTRMEILSDSLKKRDKLLRTIQDVLISESDTTFHVSDYETKFREYLDETDFEESSNKAINGNHLDRVNLIEADKIIYSEKFSSIPVFPAPAPVLGTLTQKFNAKKKHFGIDIASSKGSLVKSIADGVVITADWSINYGNTIQIQHGDGYITIIKHCSSLLKKEGDVVLKGDAIGVLGMSGVINTGPHTHIEIWRNGIALDPEPYLLLN
ncbi:MAG: M23 family metallopeptidase [Bacteroidetes bacterium]|nr:M23 family metallopeptidase [Bacteroidota bacterium]